MTREEMMNLFEAIKGMYPRFLGHSVSDIMLESWIMAFRGISYKNAEYALMKYYAKDEKGYAPRPAQLLDLIKLPANNHANCMDNDYIHEGCNACRDGYVFYTTNNGFNCVMDCPCKVKKITEIQVRRGKLSPTAASEKIISAVNKLNLIIENGLIDKKYHHVESYGDHGDCEHRQISMFEQAGKE